MTKIANPSVAAHGLVSFGGTIQGGTSLETWMCTLRVARNDAGIPVAGLIPDLTAYLNAVKTPLQTFWTGANGMRNDFQLTFLKVANIQGGALTGTGHVGGTYAGTTDSAGGPNPAQTTYASINGGAGATPTTPPFVTLCITWRCSNRPKSMAGHAGRIYLPYNVNNAGLRTGSTVQTAALTVGAALLTAFKTSAAGANPAIKPCLTARDGTIQAIDTVSVGDVWDVQRRRKDKQREVYANAAWS